MQFFTISILTCACWLMAPLLDLFNVSQAALGADFTIVIDPGHGGKDGGCLGAPVNEKEIVLDIALQFGDLIKAAHPEVKVIYTRDTDEFIPLHERARLATAKQADLFISIHCNSLPQAKRVSGSETYVMGLSNVNSNLEVAKRENAAIFLEDDYQKHYEGYDPNSVEGHILMSMVQNHHLEQSLNFAAKIEDAIDHHAHGNSRGVKQAGFVVLREATMPAVLVETGYLTNAQDNEYLQSEVGKTGMATAMFVAFSEYWAEQQGVTFAKPALASGKVATLDVDETEVETVQKPINSSKTVQAGPSSVIVEEPVTQAAIKNNVQPEAGLRYHLQLAASKNLINTAVGKWSKSPLKVEVKKEGPFYKYLSPSTASLDEVENWKMQFRQAGFPDAFIVAYQQGKRVKILK